MSQVEQLLAINTGAVKATFWNLKLPWVLTRGAFRQRQEKPRINNQSGQVVLEYILLLAISVTVATVMTKRLVGRNPENPGIITGAWSQINSAIGADIID